MKNFDLRKNIADKYSSIAKSESKTTGSSVEDISKSLGYSESEIKNIPKDANLGLGCGNPQTMANIKEGEVLVDLGSGAGFDAFIAAEKVGKNGLVIGVDMTLEMIENARRNAIENNYNNVEFRLGEIEYLPIADNTADIVISNCVINLSTDKKKVYKEMYRVLKDGGRISLSDTISIKDLPDKIKDDPNMHSC
ncbi:MAG: methyltransferase domain-containing protein [Andreesenia angusta]|nr:methyltransferase domain-containing protein [Andreesenia angusta]